MSRAIAASLSGIGWRHLLTAGILVVSLTVVLSLPSFGQDAKYHGFADRRVFLGIPNFLDVASNLAFFAVGIAGLRLCLEKHRRGAAKGWIVLFAGVTLVGFGSAYYHWAPSNATLVWDRLPMTVAFMGLFVALLGEHISDRLGAALLVPALLVGVSSVVYWHASGDLRFYVLVQLLPLLLIPVLIVLYRTGYSHRWLPLVALGWYALAKVAEANDLEIFTASGNLVSGHTMKHLLSAAGCATLLVMLGRRKSIETARSAQKRGPGAPSSQTIANRRRG
jgi:hypothetical protein